MYFKTRKCFLCVRYSWHKHKIIFVIFVDANIINTSIFLIFVFFRCCCILSLKTNTYILFNLPIDVGTLQSAVLKLTNDIHLNMADFDTICHKILLNRILSHFALYGIVMSWFTSYLSPHCQKIKVETIPYMLTEKTFKLWAQYWGRSFSLCIQHL